MTLLLTITLVDVAYILGVWIIHAYLKGFLGAAYRDWKSRRNERS